MDLDDADPPSCTEECLREIGELNAAIGALIRTQHNIEAYWPLNYLWPLSSLCKELERRIEYMQNQREIIVKMFHTMKDAK